MSNVDQCPSTTKGEKKRPSKAELAAIASSAGTIHGKKAWRSLEEVADTAEFREFLHREFPAGASELAESEGETRRNFLKLMGASLALAGAATIPGCRQPDHKIMPYSKEVPEEIIPGKPLYYATSFPRPDGGAEGLLVETHEGRPTKIEGNPLHPINQGKCSTWALASIMGMYDPDRLKYPVFNNPARGRVEASWDDFRKWAGPHFANYEPTGGEGLAFICDKQSSPTRQAAIASLRERFPNAKWVSYAPTESTSAAEGTKIAFGKPMREILNLSKDKTRVIVSLDRDFLYHEAGEIPNARQFAATRLVMNTHDEMSRLYCIESGYSITGAQADHRLRLSPSRVTSFAAQLAQGLTRTGDPGLASISSALNGVSIPKWTTEEKSYLDALILDLIDPVNRGKTLILAGESQPPEVHALVAAMNSALGNVGQSVSYMPLTEEEAYPSLAGIASLAAEMKSDKIKTLVCISTNPVYDAPADTAFGALFAKVPTTITLSVDSTETATASTWSLNGAHYLESWGDTQAIDGTRAPVQPMIAPLYEPALSDLEFITLLTSKDTSARVDGYEIVRASWRKAMSGAVGDFDKQWRRILHDGVVPGTFAKAETPTCNFAKVGEGVARLGKGPEGMEVVWTVSHVHDGRYANVAWLQELPEVGTRHVWDNAILMSPKTAEDLKLTPEGYSAKDPNAIYYKPKYPMARVAEVMIGALKVVGPAWILPGMADNTLMMAFGYGRENTGRVADGVGFNAFKARASTAVGGRYANGASITGTADDHMIASTQMHWSLEGRTSLVRAEDLQRFKKFGDSFLTETDRTYGTENRLNFAEQLGEVLNTPPNYSIYVHPYNETKRDAAPGSRYDTRPQWAMTIDQTTCTGCGVCTIACQSENNIAVVGKKEVAKGREMHWIRVDRYYTGEDVNSPEAMYHQPVACVHCENAPCETVCPVNATIHGPEGINYMTYNRCIGTRYCANNCPYKVRRFNFFDYGVTKFNGDYFFKDTVEKVVPNRDGITGSGEHNKINPNLIPPRLRQKLDEISRMQKNPDVTVRSRGVMEKCSYCIQRINAARIEMNLATGMDPKVKNQVPDGFFQAACQQACPSNSITFGDMLDEKSKVYQTKHNARSYALLGYINTRPRTSHMLRLMNPNPALVSAERKAMWDKPLSHGAGEGHEAGHEHAALFDSNKHEDGRRTLSLRVLSAIGARA
jgi:molybdopterin-containing oxidoreductase family iron-sulfur binding subunit